jgi:cardiolipin synthase
MLKKGIKIFRYEPEFLHAKTAVVDGEWATFGSFNLDNLSFLYNFEGNVVTTDPACVRELTAHFLEDHTRSREVTQEDWRRRPFTRKLSEFLVAPIRGIF